MSRIVKCKKCSKIHNLEKCPQCRGPVYRMDPSLDTQRCPDEEERNCCRILHKQGRLKCNGRMGNSKCGELVPVSHFNRPVLRFWNNHTLFLVICPASLVLIGLLGWLNLPSWNGWRASEALKDDIELLLQKVPSAVHKTLIADKAQSHLKRNDLRNLQLRLDDLEQNFSVEKLSFLLADVETALEGQCESRLEDEYSDSLQRCIGMVAHTEFHHVVRLTQRLRRQHQKADETYTIKRVSTLRYDEFAPVAKRFREVLRNLN